jgi:hypothetical protein
MTPADTGSGEGADFEWNKTCRLAGLHPLPLATMLPSERGKRYSIRQEALSVWPPASGLIS